MTKQKELILEKVVEWEFSLPSILFFSIGVFFLLIGLGFGLWSHNFWNFTEENGASNYFISGGFLLIGSLIITFLNKKVYWREIK